MPTVADLKIKIFADGADHDSLMSLYAKPYIRGFTTNPTLMRKANIANYEEFARKVLTRIKDRPVSFEVFADDFDEMETQALTISSWGANVNVKIPVSNTRQKFAGSLIEKLCARGVVVNVTAVFTLAQVRQIALVLNPEVPAIVSVFAGRIADTGVDPVPMIKEALSILSDHPKAELLWASPREVLNIFQANDAGCHIITVSSEILAKLKDVGKDLTEFSLETVTMFYRDAASAQYSIEVPALTGVPRIA
ncbi:MAG: transaldolase [Acidobacteriaceae bacterium]|jgi:transaldolase|nr:transaldolase [Acidobacteriaceae bacterium]